MFLRPRMTRTGGHAGPYVWGGVTGVTNSDNPWLTAVQENTATRLVVSGSSYDAEQRFLVNENPLSVRTALGVGLGSAGCAGPVFAPDKYGPAMWLNQVSTFSSVVATIPSGLSTTWTFTARVRSPLVASGWTRIATIQTGASQWAYIYLDGSGFIWVYPTGSGASSSSGATPQSLLGIAAGDPFYVQIRLAATALSVFVSSDGSAWTAAGTATVTATTPFAGGLLYLGSFSTSAGISSVFYEATLRDGNESAPVAAHFTPGMFVGGNRADGDTAVDAYGVTWTIERPAATTDMPRVMVGGTEQYISLPGVSGEYISTPDTAANSITGDLDIRVSAALADWSSAFQTLVSKWLSTGGQQSWIFRMTSAGSLQLVWSTTGSSVSTATSTAPVTFADFAAGFVRCTVDVDNGSSNADIRFYTSTDGTTWVQLGSTVNPGSTINFFGSTAVLAVGAHDNGTGNPTTGQVFWAEVYDGIDGTLVERFDAAEASPNSTTWTSSTSGATVTVNKSSSAQYHATVVPPNTTIVQGDGVNDFAQVCGDDTITDFVPATGLALVLDARVPVADAWGTLFADWSGSDGLQSYLVDANPRVASYLHDSVTATAIGDNADNITYGSRFLFAAAHGDSDHEAYVDGASVEATTIALVAIPAANPLRFFARPNGTNPAAFDLYGAAVLGERTSDTEAAAYATEGLTR